MRLGFPAPETCAMDVFCFDFDGVICDSAPETALAAWQGGRELWPGGPEALPAALQERFCRMRPVLHTGFEAIPLMRLIEGGAVSDADLLADFASLRDALMAREGLTVERLQQVFSRMRDDLITKDRAAWLRWNRFYPGIRETLAAASGRHPLRIITTKQRRFVTLLLENHGLALPEPDIYGLEDGRSKPEILTALLAEPALAGGAFHFIEDRLDTLRSVLADPGLGALRLYLADWGYNTPAQRQAAAETGRIEVVSLEAFRAAHGL